MPGCAEEVVIICRIGGSPLLGLPWRYLLMNNQPLPRLREIHRSEILPASTLDQLLPQDHPVRTLWLYVCQLDLSDFLDRIQAVQGHPGRDATDPRLLLALWMWATSEGVASARRLERLCSEQIPYRWLCGSVTVNYGLLSAFRRNYEEQLDQLLQVHVSALLYQGLIELKRVAQDGVRVRAHAGSGSFHRESTLAECERQVREQIERLKQQDSANELSPRQRSARKRHQEEKLQRIQQARQVANELEAKWQKRLQEHPKEAQKLAGKPSQQTIGRGSTTDPDARRMKMADGGYRPAYNVQCATTTEGGVIVGVIVSNQGTDSGLISPMLEQIEMNYGQSPQQMLVDGGYNSTPAVEAAHQKQVEVYTPLRNEAKDLAAGRDPYAPKKGDQAGMKALRQRMGTAEGKEVYKQRSSSAEWVNAGMRNRGMYQVLVRGIAKVRAVVLLQALVHNLKQTLRLWTLKKLPGSWTEILRAEGRKEENGKEKPEPKS
jgi:transposase